jgi:hypothetical protein
LSLLFADDDLPEHNEDLMFSVFIKQQAGTGVEQLRAVKTELTKTTGQGEINERTRATP